MNKYQSYKPSGVEWIGKIPEHWIKCRLKNISTSVNGYSFKSDDFDREYDIPVIRIGDVGDIIDFEDCIKVKSKFLEEKKDFIVKKNDILIGLTGGTIGKSGRYNYDSPSLLNQRVGLLRNKKEVLNGLLYHYVKSEVFIRYIFYDCYGGGQDNISMNDILNMVFPLPPSQEQLQIVQFLDEKTELIDKLISTKERKITLLKEQRTTLINQVVTKGLNPNVKMKESGVEWIGEIPEHWFCVGTNKVYQDLGTGTTPTSDNKDYYSEDGFQWITTTDLNEGVMYDTLTKISEKSLIDYPSLRLYPSGSIYISMYGGRIGKLGVSTFDSYCNQSVCVLPKNDKINVKFYYYWFLGFQDLVKNMGRGGGQPNINKEMIKQFPTVKIDLDEQNEIVEYLDSKTKEIDDLVQLEQKKIDLLKEYRQSLISEVVTGKIKVTTNE